LLDFADNKPGPADELPEPKDQTIAQKGDLFELGGHRLLVGDARDEQAFIRLMQGRRAEMAFLDPPYNVKVHGHTGGRGRVKHREFECAAGEMTPAQLVQFLKETLGLCARHAVEGSIFYVCTDWRHTGEMHEAGASIFDELKNICVWVKTNFGQGTFYRSQHETDICLQAGQRSTYKHI
jgi:hypothetical protein